MCFNNPITLAFEVPGRQEYPPKEGAQLPPWRPARWMPALAIALFSDDRIRCDLFGSALAKGSGPRVRSLEPVASCKHVSTRTTGRYPSDRQRSEVGRTGCQRCQPIPRQRRQAV
jgi:hypothetical protein